MYQFDCTLMHWFKGFSECISINAQFSRQMNYFKLKWAILFETRGNQINKQETTTTTTTHQNPPNTLCFHRCFQFFLNHINNITFCLTLTQSHVCDELALLLPTFKMKTAYSLYSVAKRRNNLRLIKCLNADHFFNVWC